VVEWGYRPSKAKPTKLDFAQFTQNVAVEAFLSMAERSETPE
jgi:hypothetical protein